MGRIGHSPGHLIVAVVGLTFIAAMAAGAEERSAPGERYSPSTEQAAMFEEPVDYVIPRSELDAFIEDNPNLGVDEDVTVGVDYSDWGTADAETGAANTEQPSARSDAETIHQGGQAAADLDAQMSAEQVPPQIEEVAPRQCAAMTGRPVEGAAVSLPCLDAAPATVAVERSLPEGDHRDVARQALALLLEGPTDAERDDGISDPLPGVDLKATVQVENDTALVDITTDIRMAGLDNVHASSIFLQTFLKTLLSVDGVDEVSFSLQGDCEQFWEAMGSDGCHTFDRDLLSPPLSGR